MVYLCWERNHQRPQGEPAALIGVYTTEAEALALCEKRARELAGPRGIVTKSLWGEVWEAKAATRESFGVGYNVQEFGPVESF